MAGFFRGYGGYNNAYGSRGANSANGSPFSRRGQSRPAFGARNQNAAGAPFPRQPRNHAAPNRKGAEPYSDPSVVFEPLDEKAYAEIAKSLAAHREGASMAAFPPEAVSVSETRDELLEIIQNERNGAKYYEKLREIAPAELSPAFLEISRECERNFAKLSEFYELMNGGGANARDAEINLPGGFRRSLVAAEEEEGKALSALRELCEKEQSERVQRLLNDISLKKLINVNKILLLLLEPA